MAVRHSLLIASLVLGLVQCHGSMAKRDVSARTVRDIVDSLNGSLDRAYRMGNAPAVVALFTPDASLSLIGLPDIRGHDGITALLTSFFATSSVVEFRLRVDEIEAYDSVAYERGTFTWSAGATAQTPKVEHGRYSIVRRRAPTGQWLIHRFLENTVPSGDSTPVVPRR